MKTQAQLLALISNESTSLADAWQAIQDLQTQFIERVARIATEQRTEVSTLIESAPAQIEAKPATKPVEAKPVVIDPDATLIDSTQAATILGVSKKSMSNYASPSTRAAYNFPIEPVRDGHRVMWDRAAIEALAAERKAA
jgi:predicted DNA-binding transcriptional regulator AlpA